MTKRKVGALEKVEANLFVPFLNAVSYAKIGKGQIYNTKSEEIPHHIERTL